MFNACLRKFQRGIFIARSIIDDAYQCSSKSTKLKERTTILITNYQLDLCDWQRSLRCDNEDTVSKQVARGMVNVVGVTPTVSILIVGVAVIHKWSTMEKSVVQ